MATEYVNGNVELAAVVDGASESGSDDEMVNGDQHVNGKLLAPKLFTHHQQHVERIKMVAKRPSQSVTVEAEEGTTSHILNPALRLLKNSRKPRNGFGRGLPKKVEGKEVALASGAGGKGTWGLLGSELYVEEEEMNGDARDPNYDSDSQGNIQLESIAPDLTEEEMQKIVEPIVLEYFEHGDTNEVTLSLEEQNVGTQRYLISVIAVMLAMDRKPSQRELTSVLISDLYMKVLTQKNIARAFDYLLSNLADIVLDTPEAPTILGNFIARCVADDCLPPKYVLGYKGKVECEFARAALNRADVLLNMKHGLVRLDNVWGVGGGTRPVKYLIKKMVLLLKEYLSSGDVGEATRCLLDLEVPHFHHELVYEALVMMIEDMGERAIDLMCKLLKSLFASIIVTPDQMKRGFERVFNEMPDICIDVPPAYSVLEKFVAKCQENAFLSDEIVRKMPSRGRKRFVSEGDGGRIKENSSGY
uniref:Programmed cell death protein 4 n=1 Tax=Strigamia maritima TaxID=126957 RepID=T1IIT8_STRMM